MPFTKTKGDQVEIAESHFHRGCNIVLNNKDIEPTLRESFMKMFNSFIWYQREDSYWILVRVMGVVYHIVQYNPIKGSGFLPLPCQQKTHRQRPEYWLKMLHVVGISCSLPMNKSSRKSCELCTIYRKARLRISR